MKLFLHVDFQTRFAPQRRTIFHFSSHQVALPTALANLSTARNYNLKTMQQQCFAICLPFRAPCFSFFCLSD
jgi:hypothetical protein